MIRILIPLLSLALFGSARLSLEQSIAITHRNLRFHTTQFDLALRDQLGQVPFIAGLSGFRSLVADFLFIQAHIAWERTEWGRVLLLFRQITTLQPRAILYWETAAWHMAWNASAAAFDDPKEPSFILRTKAQREYFQLGKDFLERGIRNNPERPELYEALARLYRDKYHDHEHAAEFFEKAAGLPGAPSYVRRFAAYELSRCRGREEEAYDKLLALYGRGKAERAPTLIRLLKEFEMKLDIPLEKRIADENVK